MTNKNITFEELNKIIETSTIVESNEDVNQIIYNFTKIPPPKFKVGESCIRNYGGGKKQFVSIDSFRYDEELNTYTYEYSYFPSSDGFALESGLIKLTEEQKISAKECIFNMPMDMCSWNQY